MKNRGDAWGRASDIRGQQARLHADADRTTTVAVNKPKITITSLKRFLLTLLAKPLLS